MTIEVERVEQGTLEGGKVARPVRYRFTVPLAEIRAALESPDAPRCWVCARPGIVCDSPAGLREVEVYDSPWEEESTTVYVHDGHVGYRQSCMETLHDSSLTDFGYEYCEACYRDIIVRCPSNGWHEYFRYDEDGAICLRCYEEDIFANGLPREKFLAGQIPGMFCNPAELREHGFELVEGYENVCIQGQEDADGFGAAAIRLIDSGHAVAVDYERMAIGGLEGYVSLYARKEEED